jgi:cytochrome c-type biogenesis protein CcmH/NrfG
MYSLMITSGTVHTSAAKMRYSEDRRFRHKSVVNSRPLPANTQTPMSDPDISQQILEELRKLRRYNQRAMVIVLVVFLALCVYLFLRLPPHHDTPWAAVSAALRQSDYPKALRLAQEQATAHPADYYAHEYLGNIYLAMGDSSHAESEYARAYELLPSDDIKALLDAVRKRRENEAPKPP